MRTRFIRLLKHVFVALVATVLVTVAAVYFAPAWHSGLIHLLARSWVNFMQGNSTNTRGFFNPILVSLSSVVLTLFCIGSIFGREAMLKHWWENTGITALVTVTVLLVIYGPQFVWSVAGTVFREHGTDTTQIVKLRADNLQVEQLRSERDALKTTNQKLREALEENKKPQVTHYWLKMEPRRDDLAKKFELRVFAMTDGKIERAKLRLSCAQPFSPGGLPITFLPSSSYGQVLAFGMFNNDSSGPSREENFTLNGGGWAPSNPLYFSIVPVDDYFRPNSCSLKVTEIE